MRYWWLSFVDRVDDVALPLGVAIVPGRDMADAVSRAWQMNCNPGGEVLAWPINRASMHYSLIGKLLSDAELLEVELALLEGVEPPEPEEDEHLMSDYDDSHLAQYDDDPNPYHGDYSE